MSAGRRGCPVTLVILFIVLTAFTWHFCGVYTIQPMGAMPKGVTAVVWRADDEPFFNSADGLCLKRLGEVSLLCRLAALGRAPTSRIILRLPYMEWAYEASTGGRSFDR